MTLKYAHLQGLRIRDHQVDLFVLEDQEGLTVQVDQCFQPHQGHQDHLQSNNCFCFLTFAASSC